MDQRMLYALIGGLVVAGFTLLLASISIWRSILIWREINALAARLPPPQDSSPPLSPEKSVLDALEAMRGEQNTTLAALNRGLQTTYKLLGSTAKETLRRASRFS